MQEVRPPAVAGSWYPGTKAQLEAAVDGYLNAAMPAPSRPRPRAIVAPHAGLMYSGPVAACSYKLMAQCRYSAAVLIGPSHFLGFEGVSIWPRGAWETPLGLVPVDESLAGAIAAACPDLVMQHPPAHGREHSLEMQLPFIARVLPGVPIVPLAMGYQTRATVLGLADGLAEVLRDRNPEDVLLVASSDLSHYENADNAAKLDGVVIDCVDAFNHDGLMDALEEQPRHACGGGCIVTVLRAASLLGSGEARVVCYADSGDVSGDKSSVVGYMAAAAW